MRISDWSSDVCSSDLVRLRVSGAVAPSASTAAAGSHRTGPSLSPPRVVGYEAAKIPGPAVLASAFGGCCGTDHRHIERSAANASWRRDRGTPAAPAGGDRKRTRLNSGH